MRRWPTAGALAAAALIWSGGLGGVADALSGLGAAGLLLPLAYLILNQIGRRGASWPVLGAMVAAILVIDMLAPVSLSTVVVAVALILLIWGAVSGTPNGRASFGVQAAGMLGFGAIALA